MASITLPFRPAGTDTRVVSQIIADFDAILAQANGNLEASTNVKVGVAGAALTGNVAAEGSSASLARADHTHLVRGVEQLAVDPASGHFVGRIYFHTGIERLRVCVDAGGTYVTIPDTFGAAAGRLLYAVTPTDPGWTNTPADRQVLRAVGAVPTWVPHEVYYEERTTDALITAATEGTAATIIAGAAVTYEAVPYLFEFVAPRISHSATGVGFRVVLFQDGVALGNLISMTGTEGKPCYGARRLPPSPGSHTYSVRGWVGSGTGTISAGLGGASDAAVPAFLRITRD